MDGMSRIEIVLSSSMKQMADEGATSVVQNTNEQ